MKDNLVLGIVQKEFDPSGQTKGGVKFDGAKPPVWTGAIRYFGKALEATSFVSLFGFEKYGEWFGWKKVPNAEQRYGEALGRHITREDDTDPGDGAKLVEMLKGLGIKNPTVKLMHRAQAAWNALALLELTIEREKNAG